MKEKFIKILETAGIFQRFKVIFGDDWEAKKWHLDGWWFEGNSISYRSCDLFDNHEDGYNWDFALCDEFYALLNDTLISNGFIVTHNSGDEEDAFYCVEQLDR